jgi:hypothetical protein
VTATFKDEGQGRMSPQIGFSIVLLQEDFSVHSRLCNSGADFSTVTLSHGESSEGLLTASYLCEKGSTLLRFRI